ncbi:MAG: pyridoxal phosphate-dependent aminotransferase [Chloroflexota bacterium]|nr:pyridoxal phosphate-dependent aminotransferase [Chloroflexota bacterium]
MASNTKSAILAQHRANDDLNTPLLSQVARADSDLAADGMRSPLAERIIAAASAALEDGQTHYVDVPGIGPLRAAVADYLKVSSGANYRQGNIVITAGLQESRFLSIQMIGEQYDSIALPAVVHPGVRKALGVRSRNPRTMPVDPARGYLPSIDAIAETASDGCRLFYLESPSRLSGAAFTAGEVAAISQILADKDAALIWDQGLAPWVDGAYASPAALDSDCARVAAIGEAYSGMGLASWFVGYIAAPEAWVPALQSQKQIMAICTSTASQYAALEADQLYSEARTRQLSLLGGLRADLLSAASQAGLRVVKGGAVNLIALQLSADNMNRLRRVGIDFAAGRLFGAPDLVRLNVNHSTAAALAALS